MIRGYKGIAARLMMHLASHWREIDAKTLG
jgi:hypothetical protein